MLRSTCFRDKLPWASIKASSLMRTSYSVPSSSVEEVTLTTADGLSLAARWHSAGGLGGGAGVLLLHQYSRDRNDYYQLFPIFEREGISTLAIDFRSHGGSDAASVSQEELLSDPDQLIHDVRAGSRSCAGRSLASPRWG